MSQRPIDRIRDIKMMYMKGDIDYDEAKRLATPFMEEMDRQGREIAKKHGKKFPGVSFAHLMR